MNKKLLNTIASSIFLLTSINSFAITISFDDVGKQNEEVTRLLNIHA